MLSKYAVLRLGSISGEMEVTEPDFPDHLDMQVGNTTLRFVLWKKITACTACYNFDKVVESDEFRKTVAQPDDGWQKMSPIDKLRLIDDALSEDKND